MAQKDDPVLLLLIPLMSNSIAVNIISQSIQLVFWLLQILKSYQLALKWHGYHH